MKAETNLSQIRTEHRSLRERKMEKNIGKWQRKIIRVKYE